MANQASAPNILERMVIDTSVEPTNLSISLLKSITNNFSDDQKIGNGGFAVVYKGTLKNGLVAVKKLSKTLDVDEANFHREVYSMLRVKHKNIVRFLGYCSDTQGIVQKFQGKDVMAEERQRFLCFEFLPLGSLDKYISDALGGLNWTTRYRIIKGICEGLHYLHEQRIVHLDLKPANILLDQYMVPKLADFGISRCFDEQQSHHITSNPCGTLGYMAPESHGGLITMKSDIYSLGIIIMEILTGQKFCPVNETVLETWRTRFEMSLEDTRLEPIQVCAEIGIECTEFNQMKRPNTAHILKKLDEMEQTYGIIAGDHCTSSVIETEVQCEGYMAMPFVAAPLAKSDPWQLTPAQMQFVQLRRQQQRLEARVQMLQHQQRLEAREFIQQQQQQRRRLEARSRASTLRLTPAQMGFIHQQLLWQRLMAGTGSRSPLEPEVEDELQTMSDTIAGTDGEKATVPSSSDGRFRTPRYGRDWQ